MQKIIDAIEAGEELQYYDDVVAMLKAEMEKQEVTHETD